jgi:hypothetical protein
VFDAGKMILLSKTKTLERLSPVFLFKGGYKCPYFGANNVMDLFIEIPVLSAEAPQMKSHKIYALYFPKRYCC